MNPGLLRHEITIYRLTGALDEGGYYNGEDREKVCTVRASVRDASAREIYDAYAAKVLGVVNFRIRPRAGLVPGMLVSCEGVEYEILAVQRGSTIGSVMTLKTRMREAV